MELFYINLSLAGLQLSAWIQILMLFQRPYPSTLGLIGTSKLACHESNAWRASHDSESYTIAGSQLLTSKWGWLPWLPSVYDFDKVSQLFRAWITQYQDKHCSSKVNQHGLTNNTILETFTFRHLQPLFWCTTSKNVWKSFGQLNIVTSLTKEKKITFFFP